MSQIVEAIDAEIGEVQAEIREIREAITAREDRLADLDKLRQAAVQLNGGGAVPPKAEKPKPSRKPKPKQTSAPKRKPRQAPAPKTTPEDRQQRADDAEGEKRRVLAYVREHGEISYAQTAELLGVSVDTAKKRLQSIVRSTDLKAATGKRPEGVTVGRPPVVFRLNATGSTSDDGPKTSVERRVVDAVTSDGPIDEGTLAFSCNLSIADCRSVTSGLIRRGVLTKREEEGVTLFEVPA